jgi:hypothetical protein
LPIVAALALAACNCENVADVSSGTCRGTLGGAALDAALDSASSYHHDWPGSESLFELSCGSGALVVKAASPPIAQAPVTLTLMDVCGPPRPGDTSADGGAPACTPTFPFSVTVSAPGDRAVSRAVIDVGQFTDFFGSQLARGTLAVDLFDGSKFVIDFAARHDAALDVGRAPGSSSGGGGGGWD